MSEMIKYIRGFDCDYDYIYMAFNEEFYTENKTDIEILVSSPDYKIVESMDTSIPYSEFDSDSILEAIFCHKEELKEVK